MNEEEKLVTQEQTALISNEEIMTELKRQGKLIKAILVILCILASFLIVYVIFKLTVGSVVAQIIGAITGLFS